MSVDLDELREKAQKAPWGPWPNIDEHGYAKEFIAEVDPKTVLALIDEVEGYRDALNEKGDEVQEALDRIKAGTHEQEHVNLLIRRQAALIDRIEELEGSLRWIAEETGHPPSREMALNKLGYEDVEELEREKYGEVES